MAEWPAGGLESVKACPVCASKQRRLLYRALQDNVFYCAPGEWDLYQCIGCESAYIDERPTLETIHLAYQTYYTHVQAERLPAEHLHGLRWVQRVMANGYKNWRFGTNFRPSSVLGLLATLFMPSTRAMLDTQFRHLPPAPVGGRVLDVGSGNGAFLDNAKLLGWEVVGLDIDPTVVKSARERGLNVHQGGLETLSEKVDSFDVITMNHVIEHVHDPISVLNACNRLLRPGGQLWLVTPNINSLGHARFKSTWRGLEIPRHLVIFNYQSLLAALYMAEFMDIKDIPQPSPCHGIYAMSHRMELGLNPHVDIPIPFKLRTEIAIARFVEWWIKPRREFLAVTAIKKPCSVT